MSVKERFTEEEWSLIRAAPALIGAGVMASDPGGLISAVKEMAAMGSSTRDALKDHENSQLLKAIVEARDEGLKEETRSIVDGATSAMDKRERLQGGALERLQQALALLQDKVDPAELAAYKRWVSTMAHRMAEAGKEGGFMGFGGVSITESEQAFLDRVEAIMS
jgi:hypothetical protein